MAVSQASLAQESPHWKKGACQTCHVDAAPVDGVVNLTEADTETLCESCHGDRGNALPCRHSSGTPVGNMNIDEVFRESLNDGNVTCTTCHDVVFQCKNPNRLAQYENRGFLRDRDYLLAEEYCVRCHESSDYEKLSPHAGIAGTPPRPTCNLCHASIPTANTSGEIELVFNMEHDLNDACRGCHNVKPHPRNLFTEKRADEWLHLVVPPDYIAQAMQKSSDTTGIGLPLNPESGEIFCATCHNPHDFKIGGDHGSQESGIKGRLRQHNICQACHEK
jgi:predicted CXXCH cytochrome family protein